jgi:uncharacterized protein YqeY
LGKKLAALKKIRKKGVITKNNNLKMPLKKNIEDDLSQAIKGRKQVVMDSLRLFKAVLKNVEIEKRRELTDEEAVELLSRQIKKHKEAIEEFQKGGRPDLVQHEKEQAEVLEKYLPEQLSADDLRNLIKEVVQEKNVSSVKQIGLVMGEVMKRVQGRADGSRVKSLAEEVLQALES